MSLPVWSHVSVPHTILIVDDSPTAAPELRALLESSGYQVVVALRGEEALDALRGGKVDLVITETLLPNMDGFELVRHIRQEPAWAQLPIIMLTVRSAPEDYAAGFEAGANEYFIKPMEPPKILAAARGLLTRFESGRLERPGAVVPHGGVVLRPDRGEIITVFSLKGGVGTTTIAVNLAVAIKQLAPTSRVGVIDLALEHSLAALLLDIIPTSTIVDWSREDPADVSPYLLNQYFVQHSTGVSLLSAPPSPEQAETIRPDAVRRTLELAPDAFDYTVVDTASTFSEISLIALEMATTILLPVTPDMASLRSAVNTMRILKAVDIRRDKIKVVLNEIIPKAGLTREQMESGLGMPAFVLPHAGPMFIEASNQGRPVVEAAPTIPASKALLELAGTLCVPEASAADAHKAPSGNLVGRLARLRRT
jgi:pilus assembly protein CpaE